MIVTKNEINILNQMPAKDFAEIYEKSGTTLDINDGKILGYSKETEEYAEER